MRRRVALALVLIALVLVWRPILRPAAKGGIILLDVYSSTLAERNLAALVTPPPRQEDTRETLAGVEMRVSWWRPGWGAKHPAILFVSGATPAGNDMREIRLISDAVARAGYLVMLPEFPFLKEDRLDPAAVEQIDAAFGVLLAHPARRAPVGAFGFSVGGGALLAAAGRGEALPKADHIGVLGAYFDIDSYIASAVSGEQRRSAGSARWEPTEDARLRLPVAATFALSDARDQERIVDALKANGGVLTGDLPPDLGAEARALWRALAATTYDEALARLAELSPSVQRTFTRLSPRPVWERIAAPVFWLHDASDGYVPVAQADAAAEASRVSAPLRLVVPRLIQHAEPVSAAARQEGLAFWVTELGRLLGFAIDILRLAD